MKYTLDTQKILDYAWDKLPMPIEVKQRYATVFVASFVGEPEFVDRYFEIETPEGELLLIDKLDKDVIFEIAFSKTGHKGRRTGWEFLWMREAGEIIKQEVTL